MWAKTHQSCSIIFINCTCLHFNNLDVLRSKLLQKKFHPLSLLLIQLITDAFCIILFQIKIRKWIFCNYFIYMLKSYSIGLVKFFHKNLRQLLVCYPCRKNEWESGIALPVFTKIIYII